MLATLAARAPAEDFDLRRFIGMDLRSAVDALGLPQEMFSFRAAEEARDDVVFYYPDSLYLFWYKSRVWQVRCDRRFGASVFGISLGMNREQVELAAPRVYTSVGNSLYFDISDGSYPLRVRLLFSGDVLSDLYVYRSDF